MRNAGKLLSKMLRAIRCSCSPDIVVEKHHNSVNLGLNLLLTLLLLVIFKAKKMKLQIKVAEMSFLQRVAGLSLRDRVSCAVIWEGLRVSPHQKQPVEMGAS